MIVKERLYTYKDLTIVPSVISEIQHRSECNVFNENGKLPIFTAPMTTVVDYWTHDMFEKNDIIPIIPRSDDYNIRLRALYEGKWVSFSLEEFKNIFIEGNFNPNENKAHVLIDTANGHMKTIYEYVSKAKKLYGSDVVIMIGNVANPETYEEVYKCGADFCRFGIGGGNGCITSSNLGVHFPYASLIEKTYEVKKRVSEGYGIPLENLPKIIADGNIRNYDDVIKALALGADYVMIGSVFAQALKTPYKVIRWEFEDKDKWASITSLDCDKIKFSNGDAYYSLNETTLIKFKSLEKQFFGMASKTGQIAINGKATKTAEGVVKMLPIKYTLEGWVDNMKSFLKSAMSYTNIYDIKDFNPNNIVMVETPRGAYNS